MDVKENRSGNTVKKVRRNKPGVPIKKGKQGWSSQGIQNGTWIRSGNYLQEEKYSPLEKIFRPLDRTSYNIKGYGFSPPTTRVDTILRVVIILIVGKIGKSFRQPATGHLSKLGGASHGSGPRGVSPRTIWTGKRSVRQTVWTDRGKSRMISVPRLLSGRSTVDRTRVLAFEPVKGWMNP